MAVPMEYGENTMLPGRAANCLKTCGPEASYDCVSVLVLFWSPAPPEIGAAKRPMTRKGVTTNASGCFIAPRDAAPRSDLVAAHRDEVQTGPGRLKSALVC